MLSEKYLGEYGNILDVSFTRPCNTRFLVDVFYNYCIISSVGTSTHKPNSVAG